MRILAIETSCDDTAAAVVDSELRVLASVVSSQNEIHARFGGIVPELASRRHIEMIRPVVDQALAEADLTLDDIDWRAGELTVAGKNVHRDLRQGRRGFLAALGPAMARHDAPGRSL